MPSWLAKIIKYVGPIALTQAQKLWSNKIQPWIVGKIKTKVNGKDLALASAIAYSVATGTTTQEQVNTVDAKVDSIEVTIDKVNSAVEYIDSTNTVVIGG